MSQDKINGNKSNVTSLSKASGVKPKLNRSIYADKVAETYASKKQSHRTMGPPVGSQPRLSNVDSTEGRIGSKLTNIIEAPNISTVSTPKRRLSDDDKDGTRRQVTGKNSSRVVENFILKNIRQAGVAKKNPTRPLVVQDTRFGHKIPVDEIKIKYSKSKNFGKIPAYLERMRVQKEEEERQEKMPETPVHEPAPLKYDEDINLIINRYKWKNMDTPPSSEDDENITPLRKQLKNSQRALNKLHKQIKFDEL